MLEAIKIENFRSCENIDLNLKQPVVALIGKNGVGKTNVIQAIKLAVDLCAGDADSVFSLSPRERNKPTRFELKFSLGLKQYIYQLSRLARPAKGQILTESLSKNGELLFERAGEILNTSLPDAPPTLGLSTRTSGLAGLLQVIPPDSQSFKKLSTIATFLRAVHYYPLPSKFQEHKETAAIPFIAVSGYERWRALLAEGRPPDSIACRLLHMHLTAKNRLDELKKLLGNEGLDLISDIRIEPIGISQSGKKDDIVEAYFISFIPCSGIAGAGYSFRHDDLSEGTWRILRLLTYLIFDESSCMLLEQPEDSIHSGLLGKIIDILKTYSDRTQLICTTHSPRVMNLMEPMAIRVVTADEGKTRISALSSAELNESQDYLANEGTLAEYLDTL